MTDLHPYRDHQTQSPGGGSPSGALARSAGRRLRPRTANERAKGTRFYDTSETRRGTLEADHRTDHRQAHLGAQRRALVGARAADATIWSAFGEYIAAQLKQGRGVAVPALGQFTFTSKTVDLAGSTKPEYHDRQERFPVFIVAKDFAPGLTIRAGIAGGMTYDMFDEGGLPSNKTIREFTNQGFNGIIPKLKANYYEIATLTGGRATKDACKTHIEQSIKTFQEQVRSRQPLEVNIPAVGKLSIRNGIAGVIFSQGLIEECLGKTAKGFQALFHQDNTMNQQQHQPNIASYGKTETKKPRQYLKVSHDAHKWLKQNLDIEFDEKKNQAETPDAKRRIMSGRDGPKSAGRGDRIADLTASLGQRVQERKRTASAYAASRISHSYSATPSRQSSWVNSAISKVPELLPSQIMHFCNEIYGLRAAIVAHLGSGKSSMSMRDVISSSQILKIFHQIGYRLPIGQLKAILKEIGFNWNGPACSLLQLINRLKEYLNPEPTYMRQDEAAEPVQSQQDNMLLLGIKRKEGAHTVVDIIKECFYSSGKTMYQLYRQGTFNNRLDLEQFAKVVNMYSQNALPGSEIQNAFGRAITSAGKDAMTYQEFEACFKIDVPNPAALQSETQVISKMREWMFQRQYATQGAFERLLRSCDRFAQRTMTRVDFHKAIIINQVPLAAPEIDFLFDLLSGRGKLREIGYEQWGGYIYDDVQNPLQLIRETIEAESMNADDVLFQVKLKIWDEPLDFRRFGQAIRLLDSSFSDSQLKVLFSKLKNADDRVDIQVFLSNVTGAKEDTVDYRNTMFKRLYNDVYQGGKSQALLRLLEQNDKKSDGKISPQNLEKVLKQVTGGLNSRHSDEALRKFVRQLNKDDHYQVAYVEFMDKMCALGNKEHNPFKNLVQRLAYFIESNRLTIVTLLNRLKGGDSRLVPLDKFADFLKAKVEKKRDKVELFDYALMLDIDKDGNIGEEDLKTCLRNIHSSSFFSNDGLALTSSQFNAPHKFYPTSMTGEFTDAKLLDLCKQIREKMVFNKVSYQKIFKLADAEKMGLINLAQFSKGMLSVLPMSAPILEKLFNIMDTNSIGMIDLQRFEAILRAEAPAQIPKPASTIADSFDWQENIIRRIKEWVKTQKINALDAFRIFDQDFNGLISKEDMKVSLIEHLQVPADELVDTRLDRLFRLLSFFKTDQIQQSDFERLLNDVNPYLSAGTSKSSTIFKSSMGGGFSTASTHDWKFAATQQIGLIISQIYDQIEDSFLDASRQTDRVDFEKFSAFVAKHNALKGFNLTAQLLQKVFAELDPHKKTFLTLKDWLSSFAAFNQQDIIMIELKNCLQCQFANVSSAFAFFASFTKGPTIDFASFSKTVRSLIASRKLTYQQERYLFNQIAKNRKSFNQNEFSQEFANVSFTGKQTLAPQNGASSSHLGKKKSQNAQASNWENEILDKLKRLIKQSGKTLDVIFAQFDVDGSGDITKEEFHKAMKMISLGLSDNEIYKIMRRTDANNDGVINYLEFAAKFREDPGYDLKMKERANNRLATLKEQMIQYMTSTSEAYRFFDSSGACRMTYLDFDRLVRELSRLSNTPVPCYNVIRDMFDAVDIQHDTVIDENEWKAAFGGIFFGDKKMTVTATSLTYWETGAEAIKIGTMFARNRKLLIENFKQVSTHSDYNGVAKYVTFDQAKAAVHEIILANFGKPIPDDKLRCILRVGQVVSKLGQFPSIGIYDFMVVMNVYRDRYQGPQFL